jgi:hypothetical protein
VAKRKKPNFKKRSEAAKRGWETRRKNAEIKKYVPVLESREQDIMAIALMSVKEHWSSKQQASVYHSLLDFPANHVRRRMAALFVLANDTEGLEYHIDQLAEELEIDPSELWANVFGS